MDEPINVYEITQLHISVRELVEFILRSGDIDASSEIRDSLKSMQEGIRLHRWLQKGMPSEYHSEVPMRHKVTFDEYELVIEGRADGVVYDLDENPVLIDEIKGTHKDIEKINEPAIVHNAQAMCYGFFCAYMNGLDGMDIQITYGNLESREIKRFVNYYSYQDLEEFFLDLIDRYKPFSDYIYKWSITKKQSIENMVFPYEHRRGQMSVMGMVYNKIKDKELFFIQAPTGSGKTIATIYPSLKAMNDFGLSKIFYLTAKTVTKKVAKDAYETLSNQGHRLKMLEITARDKICPLEERVCDAFHCEYAKGHFDRINDAIYSIICEEDLFNRDIIYQYAEENKVCPYRLSIELTRFSDEIVCDYNYVFDPNACIVQSISDKNNIFLIDEAHNLVDRARNMYSIVIVKEDVLAMKKLYGAYDKSLIKYFDRVNKQMLALKKECDDKLIIDDHYKLDTAIINLKNRLEKFFDKKIKMSRNNEALEFYFNIYNYIDTLDYLDETYLVYADYDKSGCFRVHLFNMDPSLRLQYYLDNAVSSMFFSATLLPINYYKELLCRKENPVAIYAESVFKQSQRRILIADDVTSKYSERSSEMYKKIASYIIKASNVMKGNYIVFFPSYVFMNNVYDVLLEMKYNLDIIIQDAQMAEHDRENFMREFEEKRDKSLVAFCVLGGIFSEGIDLTNDKLIGSIIVGTGLPQTNFESDVIVKHFDGMGKNGFDYAYRFPGMNKVAQAAGRVIRTEEDKGIILLLDYRFLQSSNKTIFPKEWNDASVTNINKVEEDLEKFWHKDVL